MYEQIIAGVVTGIGYSIIGWKKQIKKKKSKFAWLKLVKSVVICSIVGGIAGYLNTDFNVALTGTVGIGVTKGVSIVWDLIKKYFVK